ncbi:MAG: protoporphyrinogen oxidase HemJ [Crocinitomicaceae bacterium]|nr:protoporphyrinogen oxidase HemJ [Crocinitomicaceae bacterium]
MEFGVVKSLHIIFMVSWFAGLFYIVRLYIYHTEAQQKSVQEKVILSKQFQIMESKLWWIITTPAMILTITFGVWMLIIEPFYLKLGWMHIKLTFIILLLVYHFICQRLLFQLKKGVFKWSSLQLRLWNEVATLVLVVVVFLVVLKNNLSSLTATLLFFGVAIGLMLAIQLYKKLRMKKND